MNMKSKVRLLMCGLITSLCTTQVKFIESHAISVDQHMEIHDFLKFYIENVMDNS